MFDKFYLTWGNQRGPHSTSSDGETQSNSRDVTWMITHSPFNKKMQIKADRQLILLRVQISILFKLKHNHKW